jgi:Ca-activated chloride channel family protein
MELATPAALLLLLLVPIAALLMVTRGSNDALPVATTAGLRGLRPPLRMRVRALLPLLRLGAIALFAFVAAGPRIGDANAVVPGEGIDIVLSIDVSSSMLAGWPGERGRTRLDAVLDVIREFVRERRDDRIGVVAFQQEALALAPPTLDHAAIDAILAELGPGLVPDGTAIGLGLATAVNMLRESTAASRVVILLTDGQHNAPGMTPIQAMGLARALNVRVYTVGAVDAPGDVDERLLTRIAEETGGRYFSARDRAGLAGIYDEIARLETSQVGRDRYERFTELAPWFLVPAIVLLALDLVLRGTWLRAVPS